MSLTDIIEALAERWEDWTQDMADAIIEPESMTKREVTPPPPPADVYAPIPLTSGWRGCGNSVTRDVLLVFEEHGRQVTEVKPAMMRLSFLDTSINFELTGKHDFKFHSPALNPKLTIYMSGERFAEKPLFNSQMWPSGVEAGETVEVSGML